MRRPAKPIVADVACATLGLSPALGKRLKRKLERPQGPVQTAFVLARDPKGRPVGAFGASWRGDWGHARVGVVPEYRQKGLSRHMAKVRATLFRRHGVTRYGAWVNSENAPSLATTKSHGYRELQRTMTWR
ncbi:MAG: GNAT family N-acetyltransferase [Alphaproteobacteria bacterium]